jgi:glucan phosphoethanolaminetransferase (alkaline phosphatase superfamily)
MLTILVILNALLAGLLGIFLVKNFLINYRTSKKLIRPILIISLIVIGLVCSLVGVTESFTLKENIDNLKNELSIAKDSVIINGVTEKEYIQSKLTYEENKIKFLPIYPIIGYITYPIILFINKKVIEESNKISTTARWYSKDIEK